MTWQVFSKWQLAFGVRLNAGFLRARLFLSVTKQEVAKVLLRNVLSHLLQRNGKSVRFSWKLLATCVPARKLPHCVLRMYGPTSVVPSPRPGMSMDLTPRPPCGGG